ncbi:hypothetical protein E2542_SST02160 [Spatholobus suberectus]|nr:hypothetical protein E2542_SST02160 [Spatholobus suberectus]
MVETERFPFLLLRFSTQHAPFHILHHPLFSFLRALWICAAKRVCDCEVVKLLAAQAWVSEKTKTFTSGL